MVNELKALHNCSKAAQELSNLQEQKEQQFNDFINAIPQAIENAVMSTAGKAFGVGEPDGTA